MNNNGLWTPNGVNPQGISPLGLSKESGNALITYQFLFKDKKTGRSRKALIPADPSMGPDEVEDLAAQAYEDFILDVRQMPPLLKCSVSQRQEIGRTIRDFREMAKRRRASSKGKVHFRGI